MKQQHTIQIDGAKCIGCGLCLKDCPAGNLTMAGGKASVIAQGCIQCGHCVAVCPRGAVSMTGFSAPPLPLEPPVTLDPQQLLKALGARRSIRQFTAQPVDAGVIHQIIEAGRLTPTAKNAQDVSYILLQKDMARYEMLAVRLFRRLLPFVRLVNATARRTAIDEHFFFKKAPAALLVVARDPINGALAASNMALMAESCGLGVLYSGFFTVAANHSPALRRALGLARGDTVVTTLVLGHPAVKYHRTAPKEDAALRIL